MKLKDIIWAIASIIVVVAALWAQHTYLKPATIHTVTNTHTIAHVAPAIVRVKTERVTINDCTVSVYHADSKDKLVLPPEVISDPSKHVVLATLAGSNLHDQTVTTILDSTTGKAYALIREEPLPRFRLKSGGHVGIGLGIKPTTGATVRITAGADFLQLRAWHLGVGGTLDSDGSAYAGGQIVRRW